MDWVRKNLFGVLTLVVVAVSSAFAVNYFKKPGQLTVVEANVMDMNAMKPPKGALPVGIKTAKKARVEGTITYTGTVRAFEDEDIYPRISGRIEKMPVYPGDKVAKGQLLVQLDTENSEYKTRSEAAKYLSDAKQHEAGMARKDFEQAKFSMKAADEAEQAAKSAVSDAQASYDYWVPEIKRQEALLKEDVVSRQEYDDEFAKYKSAKAKLEKAKAELREATNSKLAAKAAYERAVHHVGHEYSISREANAGKETARTIDTYRQIRASKNGVVVKRLISPGVLVEPGMLILKVSHIDKVRVQAEVSNSDIDKVRLGDSVLISRNKGSSDIVNAKITAIFPSADQSSRTSIVEALIENKLERSSSAAKQVQSAKQYKFLPGQYVVMNIVTGSKVATTVPTEAVFYREGKPHVWMARSNAGDSTSAVKKAILVQIETGLKNPRIVEVTKGVRPGDEIIYAGYKELQPNLPVVAVKWTNEGIERLPFASEVSSNRLSQNNKWILEKKLNQLSIKISTNPNPPKSKDNEILVQLKRGSKSLSEGVTISGVSSMPGMDMKGPDLKGKKVSTGLYKLKTNFHSGLWKLEIDLKVSDQTKTPLTFSIEVP